MHPRQRRVLLAASAVLSIALGVFACSNDATHALPLYDGDSGPGFDATLPVFDAGHRDSAVALDASDAGAPDAHDANVPPLNGCGEADFADADYTALDASRIIRFPDDAQPGMYDPQCMRIKAGESVRWQGNFFFHPLAAFNGDPTNPIPSVSDAGPDGSITVQFLEAGAFGYQCQVHATMYGAIEVK